MCSLIVSKLAFGLSLGLWNQIFSVKIYTFVIFMKLLLCFFLVFCLKLANFKATCCSRLAPPPSCPVLPRPSPLGVLLPLKPRILLCSCQTENPTSWERQEEAPDTSSTLQQQSGIYLCSYNTFMNNSFYTEERAGSSSWYTKTNQQVRLSTVSEMHLKPVRFSTAATNFPEILLVAHASVKSSICCSTSSDRPRADEEFSYQISKIQIYAKNHLKLGASAGGGQCQGCRRMKSGASKMHFSKCQGAAGEVGNRAPHSATDPFPTVPIRQTSCGLDLENAPSVENQNRGDSFF